MLIHTPALLARPWGKKAEKIVWVPFCHSTTVLDAAATPKRQHKSSTITMYCLNVLFLILSRPEIIVQCQNITIFV